MRQEDQPIDPNPRVPRGTIYRFDRFTLDPVRGALLAAGGTEVALRPKAFTLLRQMVENAGRLINKDEIMATVWPDVIVTDDSVTQLVKEIRRALGDEEQRLLRTVPRRGFLFAAEVSHLDDQATLVVNAERTALPLPDHPSLVVLPFQNMSGDPEQEYFADGMVEDITTVLSRVRWLFVIARNSAFTYKGKAVDVRQVGRELGVRYVLEGSVRRAGGRVRITGQLVEAQTGAHLWADRFDGELADVFDLQDRITEAVARAVLPSLRGAEMERAERKPTGNLDAYDLYLRALPNHYAMTREGNFEAVRLVQAALALEPRYATAAALCATVLGYRYLHGWCDDAVADCAEAVTFARRAIAYAPADPEVLAMAASGLGTIADAVDEAAALAERAVSLNPNSAFVLHHCGWLYQFAGRHREAIDMMERARRADPLDPMAYSALAGLAQAQINMGDPEGAVRNARQAVDQNPRFVVGLRVLAAALALSGRQGEAEAAARRVLALQPGLTIRHIFERRPQAATARKAYIEGLRRAGIPE